MTVSNKLASRDLDPRLIASLRDGFGAVPAIEGALLMGSRARGIAHARSNADVQIVVQGLTAETVSAIIGACSEIQSRHGFPVSVNVHTLADSAPSLSRHGLFMHKNRAELFVYQAKYTGVPLFGRNSYSEFPDPSPSRTRIEAIRVIASFCYFLRKYIFDASMAAHGTAEFVRTPLISLEYVAVFYGYISMGYRDGLDFLIQAGKLTDHEIDLLHECARRKSASEYDDLGVDFALRVAAFMDSLHLRLISDYRRLAVSDVRWDGKATTVRWGMEYPQAAAMTIMRRGDEVLLLRRPADDYLYPGLWTVAGGYLAAGESPTAGARREVLEETGISLEPFALFECEPLISDRLAAFVFEVALPETATPRLSEHENYRFAHIRDIPSLPLTVEARMIFERYLNLPTAAVAERD
ncbi:NUDIX hydrolase [Actinospica robiniae]|uniref:NUDIX hydrolase n=1 Tax=Actinospica robiniae TaxID=304901 RepID=UPI00146FA978|nr:NUDIX hydrolase [Actinospica robiniae]